MAYMGITQEVFTGRDHAECMQNYMRFKNSLDTNKYQFVEHACVWDKDARGYPSLVVVYRVTGTQKL